MNTPSHMQSVPLGAGARRRLAGLAGSSRRSATIAAAAAFPAFAAYYFALAPDLTWANGAYDGGELITASMTLGIPHPPGYPLYVITGRLFSLLPIGTIAFRFNLFSAVCVAVAAGLLALSIRRLWPRLSVGAIVAAVLTFAYFPLVWSQAVVAEVYGLNLLIVSAFLLALVSAGVGFRSGVLFGLALVSHPTSVFLLPMAAWLPGRRVWPRFVAGAAVGLTPLLLLPVFAYGSSPVIWGDPRTLAGWLWIVTAQIYKANVGLPADLFNQLTVLSVAALAGLTIAVIIRSNQRGQENSSSKSGTMRVICAVLLSISLYVAFAALYRTPDRSVNLLPALLLGATLWVFVYRRLGVVTWVVPLILLVMGMSAQNLRGDYSVRQAAVDMLHDAPTGAILLTPGDRTVFTLWYFHHVEGMRPDVYLIDTNLFAFEWYRARLAETYPELIIPEVDNVVALRDLNRSAMPICTASLVSESTPRSAQGGSGKSSGLRCTGVRP